MAVHPHHIEIFYKVGLNSLLEGSKIIDKNEGLSPGEPHGLSEDSKKYFGSNSLTNGAPDRTRTSTPFRAQASEG